MIDSTGIVWIHCASLGEFEQGRPLCEKLKQRFPQCRILLTFFSPSGYEIRKDYKGADWVFYLPMDSLKNARRLLQIVKPSLVIFVKYEFWYYYLRQLHENKIPLLLVSAIFRKNSVFFRWYGGLQRRMLSYFDQLFVQDEESRELLTQIGIHHTVVSGDTRFDRVMEIAGQFQPLPFIEEFVQSNPVIVAGSTWPQDEVVLQKSLRAIGDPALKLIIAPHEIKSGHIAHLQNLFPSALLLSQMNNTGPERMSTAAIRAARVLIIDNIGLLSKLYNYATISYIGGGFGKGIHNTLEAAVYGRPVLFGPEYQKFREAVELVRLGGAIAVRNATECSAALQKMLHDIEAYRRSCAIAKDYVSNNRGATEKVLDYIQEKRLLTN